MVNPLVAAVKQAKLMRIDFVKSPEVQKVEIIPIDKSSMNFNDVKKNYKLYKSLSIRILV